MTPIQLAKEVAPVLRKYADDVDRTARFPTENMAALRGCGLLGLLVPERHGGLGGTLWDLIDVAGILAAECLSTAMIWVMHNQQVDAIMRFAQPELRESLLPRIAAGDMYLASVTTEKGKGGHLLTAIDPLNQDDDSLKIDRDAPVVTGGLHADGFLITMRSEPTALETQLTLVFADRSQLSVTRSGEWNPMGMRATESPGLHLEGTVPQNQVLGAAGKFREIALESFAPFAHIAWAACWIGAARSAFATVVPLCTASRSSSLGIKSDLVASRLGRIRMELEVAHAYLHSVTEEVVELRQRGETPAAPAVQIHLNTLKVVASESSFRVVDELVQLAGLDIGYMKGKSVPLERVFRDLRSASLNYHNDRLSTSNGHLCLLDRSTRLC